MSLKLLVYDTETTGLNFRKNGIHQISGMVVIDDVIKEEFDIKVRPFKDAKTEIEALNVSGVTEEQIMAYPPFDEGYRKFISYIGKKEYIDKFNPKDKYFLVGFNNAEFDDYFLSGFFAQNGDKYTFDEEFLRSLFTQNADRRSFDNDFLRDFFIKNGDKYFGSYFWSSPLDVMVLAANKLKNERHLMENFKLKTVAKYLGIPVDDTKLHDASYDLRITYEVYKLVS